SMPMHNIPVRLSETPGGFARPAPDLGADNAAILDELGAEPAPLPGHTLIAYPESPERDDRRRNHPKSESRDQTKG
ncbi:MAG: hypothetical protein ACREFZ_04480, partial [Acetobacteraceae bacterium]